MGLNKFLENVIYNGIYYKMYVICEIILNICYWFKEYISFL